MANLAQQRLARANAALVGEPIVARARDETSLRDIIEDPILHRLMESDGIERDHLIGLLRETRTKLARRQRA